MAKQDAIQRFLSDISNHAHYQDFVDLVGQHRPRIPLHDSNKDLVEEWKSKSGQQKGYDLFASLLNLKFED